jgi:2-alkenal reductase
MSASSSPLKLCSIALLAVSLTACLPTSGQQAAAPPATAAPTQAAAAPTPAASPAAAPAASPAANPAASPAAAPAAPPAASPAAQAALPAGQSSPAGTPLSAAAMVYQQQARSVVNINATAVASTPFGPARQEGSGSGIVFDREGRIITNNHVVQDASQLSVVFKDGMTVPARLVGRDPDNDLAVIQVDPGGTDDQGRPVRDVLFPAVLADSDQVVIGNPAIAIGSPLGLQQTVTAGIVSAIRSPLEETRGGQIELLGGAIQTDAAINPGNSGGPLFNEAGQVIGVNTAILSGSGGNIGIGFAIPINVAKRIVPELIQYGCYRHPLIGVTTISLARLGQQAKQQLGIPTNLRGLLVQEVSAGAAQAGLRAGDRAVNVGGESIQTGGDIIVAIDGQPVQGGGDLRAYIENTKRPGDTVTLSVLRGGQRQDLSVRLSERPNNTCP